MDYSEILAAYEADDIDFMSALELTGCGSIIELYELVASEKELRSTAILTGTDRQVA